MAGNNFRFIEALVVTFSDSSEAFYAYAHDYFNDIIIDACYCPKDIELVGKWIEVGIDIRNRARQKVSIIEDKFPTRTIGKHVEVNVEVDHDGRTNENIEMFRNDYFGYICDPNSLLYDIRSGVKYRIWITRIKLNGLNCRWRVSTEQDSIDPYFLNPTSSSLTSSMPHLSEGLETVIGIVTSHSKKGKFWLVWSSSRPRSSIGLDYDFCPSEVDMLGKWAEMKVDDRNSVCEPIRIVSPYFETRVIAGLAEFRIDFKHTKRYQQEFEMFDHHYFGAISDSFKIMGHAENGAWYNGWIVYSNHPGAQTCWRLAIKQRIQGPFRHRQERGRSTSPYIRNEYNMDESSSRSSRRRSRSNDVRTRDNSFERHNNMRFNDSPSPDRKIKYDEGSSYIHTNSKYNEIRRSDVESSEYSGSRMNAFPHNNHRRRSRSADRNNSHHSTNNGYPQDENAENRRHCSQPSSLSSNSRLIEKDNYSQSSSFEVEKTRVVSKTEQEKQIIILKQRLSRMSQLVLSLTTDESVSMPMKMWNVEEYEDLIELAKKPV